MLMGAKKKESEKEPAVTEENLSNGAPECAFGYKETMNPEGRGAVFITQLVNDKMRVSTPNRNFPIQELERDNFNRGGAKPLVAQKSSFFEAHLDQHIIRQYTTKAIKLTGQ